MSNVDLKKWMVAIMYLIAHNDTINYTTTAPTAANTNGGLKIAVLSTEPTDKYNGWIYFITE